VSPRPLLIKLTGAAVMVAALAGCGSHGSQVAAARTYLDGPHTNSPLSAYSGLGGFAADPTGPHAEHGVWEVSAGQFFLCVPKPGTQVTITKVVPHILRAAPPLAETTWMRAITRDQVRRTAPKDRTDFEGVNSKGSPPDWKDPRRTFYARGTWSKAVSGTRITTTCKQRMNADAAVTERRVPKAPIVHELVITLRVGPAGGSVHGFDIHFTSDGRPGILKVTWDISACGTAWALRALGCTRSEHS